MRIGRLNIGWAKKSITPGRELLNLFGLSIAWGNNDSKAFVHNYSCISDVYTVVTKVAKTCSYAPFKVYRIKDRKKHYQYKSWIGEGATVASTMKAISIKSQAYEEDNSHPLNKLIEKPNQWQKGREFTENSIGFKLLTGERIWHIVKVPAGANEGLPYEVYNLPPQHITVIGDGTVLGIKGFQLLAFGNIVLRPEEIVFSRYFNPDYNPSGTHLRGLSPFKAGRKLTTVSDSGITRAANMLQNAGATGIVYEKPSEGVEKMTEQQAKDLKLKLNTEVIGLDQANSIAVGNGDLGYINFGIKGTEMELINLMNLTLERICALVSVPPVLFNTDRAIQNNLQEAKKELIVSACCPELDSLRESWNEIAKLYKKNPNEDDSIYVDYDLSVYPELQEDLQKLSKIALDSWWLTGNEKRLMMYQDEDKQEPMLDTYLVPSGLTPIEDLSFNQVDMALMNQNDQTGNNQNGNGEISQNREGDGLPKSNGTYAPASKKIPATN